MGSFAHSGSAAQRKPVRDGSVWAWLVVSLMAYAASDVFIAEVGARFRAIQERV
jgi:hypothetical protein